MAVRQITVRLAPERKLAFEEYAAAFGLDASSLVKLLIAREWRLKRLAQLTKTGTVKSKPRRAAGTGSKPAAITAHMRSLSEVASFNDYAYDCGLKRDGAGAWLLETELMERWLEKAIDLT